MSIVNSTELTIAAVRGMSVRLFGESYGTIDYHDGLWFLTIGGILYHFDGEVLDEINYAMAYAYRELIREGKV